MAAKILIPHRKSSRPDEILFSQALRTKFTYSNKEYLLTLQKNCKYEFH